MTRGNVTSGLLATWRKNVTTALLVQRGPDGYTWNLKLTQSFKFLECGSFWNIHFWNIQNRGVVYSLKINCISQIAGRSFFFFFLHLFTFFYIDLFKMLLAPVITFCIKHVNTYQRILIFSNQTWRSRFQARGELEFPPFSGNRLPFSVDTPSLPDIRAPQCFSSPDALLQPCVLIPRHSINKIDGSMTRRSPRRTVNRII